MKKLLSILLFVTCYSLLVTRGFASEVSDLQTQIDELSHLRELSASATTPLESQLSGLDKRIASAQKGIDAAVAENKRLTIELDKRQTELAVQYKLLEAHVRNLYKYSRNF